MLQKRKKYYRINVKLKLCVEEDLPMTPTENVIYLHSIGGFYYHDFYINSEESWTKYILLNFNIYVRRMKL